MMHAPSSTGFGVGASLLRKEDARHLHGRGQFVSDVRLANTQDVAFVRSPHAHASIKGITIPPDAEGRVFTARDLPRQIALDDLAPLRQGRGADVAQHHVEPGQRADMRDAAPHLPGADDADAANIAAGVFG